MDVVFSRDLSTLYFSNPDREKDEKELRFIKNWMKVNAPPNVKAYSFTLGLREEK